MLISNRELDQILEACESNGVQFMDGSMWYHHPRTSRMREFLSDPKLFGQVKTIYSSSSCLPPQQFFENDVRTKADLDGLGALGDAGWYCIGAIIWAMNYKLPTSVTVTCKNSEFKWSHHVHHCFPLLGTRGNHSNLLLFVPIT